MHAQPAGLIAWPSGHVLEGMSWSARQARGTARAEKNRDRSRKLDIRTHVAIHAFDGDELLLFYGEGLNVIEPEFADFWAPLEFGESELGTCPAVAESDVACQTLERFALQVELDGVQSSVFDSSVAAFAPQSLWFHVERAVVLTQVNFEDCFDFVGGRSLELLALKADL